ncbi:MAG: helix-turn-helix transcriptional regulator [Rhodococcus sp.]|nr:helix-turn-helix transcriptional regulator [Rhodococcus sp. (in: high G+C Gram-positive bacteria)]
MSPAALPETGCPPEQATLWLWTGHAAYLGLSLQLNAHSGSVQCLAVGIDAPFTLRAHELGERVVRSALISPRVVHQVVAHGERMLFCYIDPSSSRAEHCRDRMLEQGKHISLAHQAEAAIIHLAQEPDPDPSRLMDLVSDAAHEPVDARIATAIATLRAHPGRNLSATELAAEAHLSTSRFLHLFSAQAGTSFRRYRLWSRMLHVGASVSKGHDLTTASADAGFATPSHFSDAFHAMFGLTAAQLLTVGARIDVLDQ